MEVPLPIIISREGKWFVASCPILDIATQGRTEEEVKENMADLVKEYFRDPDTPKPEIRAMMTLAMANIPVNIPEGILHGKASPVAAR